MRTPLPILALLALAAVGDRPSRLEIREERRGEARRPPSRANRRRRRRRRPCRRRPARTSRPTTTSASSATAIPICGTPKRSTSTSPATDWPKTSIGRRASTAATATAAIPALRKSTRPTPKRAVFAARPARGKCAPSVTRTKRWIWSRAFTPTPARPTNKGPARCSTCGKCHGEKPASYSAGGRQPLARVCQQSGRDLRQVP